jgi:hypothetical protein
MRKLIRVTQDDIDKGRSGSCAYCPIARAARRAFGKIAYVCYSQIAIFDDIPKHELTLPVPKRASEFICSFDSHKLVKPFAFYVDVS